MNYYVMQTKTMLNPVPYGFDVSVEILRDIKTNTATVNVHAPLYKNKLWKMPNSYKSSEFSDREIIRDSDFVSTMLKHYPKKPLID